MAAAERHIGFVAANLYLRTFAKHVAFFIFPNDHRRFFAAVADRAHLAHLISQRQQRGGAGKELSAKIYAQPKTHDRHRQIVHRARQLPDLIGA